MAGMGNAKHTSTKKQNSAGAWRAKVELRERILEYVGAGKANVFDAFAGAGELHAAVWHRAAGYVGCDKRLHLDARTMFCADNRRVLRCIDLRAFNVFDLDAWGSPWEQAAIIAARRPLAAGERVGFVLTVGEGLYVKMGGMPKALKSLSGFAMGVPGALRDGEIVGRAIKGLAARLEARVVHHWEAGQRGGSAMRYAALALCGKSTEADDSAKPLKTGVQR